MSITTYQKNLILNYVFGKTTYTVPSTLYIGLSTTAINPDGTGKTEPSGGYARFAVTNNKTNFSVSSTGSLTNNTLFFFPTATGSWGTITHYFVCNSLGTTDIMYYKQLTTPILVGIGETIVFEPGDFDVEMT